MTIHYITKDVFCSFVTVTSYCNKDLGSSSSSVCGAGGIQLSALQPIEAYCANPAFSSPVHLQRCPMAEQHERPLLAKGGTMGKKWLTNLA
jgi:hypothetical protein